VLLHLVDMAPLDPDADPVRDARAIVSELEKYSPELAAKPCWLVLNKFDLIAEDERERRVDDFLRAYGVPGETPCFCISAINGDGCRPLLFALQEALDELNRLDQSSRAASGDDPVDKFFPDDTENGSGEKWL
jgi:GTP-binding protein